MLDTFLGLLSQDLALDLGSDRSRVYLRGAGTVLDIASAVALRTRKSGSREVVAVGDEARAMLGRTPAGLAVVRPIRSGRVVEAAVAQALLEHLFAIIHGRRGIGRPQVLLAEAADAPPRARRAMRDCAFEAGARGLRTVPKPLAAAIGAGLDAFGPLAHMVIDAGAGTTSITVISRGEIVSTATLEIGGDVMDGAVLRYLRNDHQLLVGTQTAEALKREAGAIHAAEEERMVAGRCLVEGVPKAVHVSLADVRTALAEPLSAIATGIRRVLEQTPPECANDIAGHGAFLCGGQARLRQIDLALRDGTGLAILAVDEPDRVPIDGAGQILDDRGLLHDLTTPAS